MADTQLNSEQIHFDDWNHVVEEYIERGWTDGLPIIPPTPDLVAEFLDAAGRSPSDILGTEPTKGRVITAEKVAVNSVMAGCKPEYFKIVLAAVEAMCEPEFNLHAVTASTQGSAVLAVVNGPIAREVGLNSGISVFGPGHRANATIGRAIRLVIINATGSVSGEIDKATQGHPGKYTWCIAEDEDVRLHGSRFRQTGDFRPRTAQCQSSRGCRAYRLTTTPSRSRKRYSYPSGTRCLPEG